MDWDTLRKTYIIIYVEYGPAHAKLFAENIRVRAADPFDVSIDLSKNLRTRSKGVGTFVDASRLANEMGTLKTVHISDAQILERIGWHLKRLDELPNVWRLHVELEGSHWFIVKPEVRGRNVQSLWLTVESAAEVSPPEPPTDSGN